jgi:N-acetylglucosamine-6-phosphate deacetylase
VQKLCKNMRLEKCADGAWRAPGFVDLQVNGFAGADYNDPALTPEALAASLRALRLTGVTRLLPTIITGAPERMLGALRNLAAARAAIPEGVMMAGFHLEGPHISPEDGPRGAHPRAWVRPPDLDEFQRWQEAAGGAVKLVTLAPEWPEAPAYIEALTAAGIVVGIGHTAATPAQIQEAVRAGARLSTHLGNGAHATLPRRDNYLWEQLAEDRLSASFIADGLHLSASFLRVALRAKTTARSILVTDAVAPAMCPPGDYMLGELAVESRADGSVVLRGGARLAGSSLRMDQAVANVMRLAGLSLEEAVGMASVNPARLCGITEPGWVRFQVEDGCLRILETRLAS